MSGKPNPRRGELYWANLDPSFGSEAAQVRPVLIVSSDANNKAMPTVSIAPLTSSVHRIYPFEVFLEPAESGLPKPSKIQTQQIRSIDAGRLKESIGAINPDTMNLVGYALKLHLALE
jgi:mRNA interferase MazF